jgi:hypothetical protein
MTKRMFAPALALTALATATAAQAQQQTCIAAADLGDSLLYAMPIAYDAVSTTCSRQLKRDGFMATGGEAFIAKFRARQDSAWPGAFRMIKTFMAQEGGEASGNDVDMAAMIAALPEDSLRPFVDGMVGQMIAGEIKPENCGKIERAIELLDPLPAENYVGLVTFIIELTELKNPSICPANPPAAAK